MSEKYSESMRCEASCLVRQIAAPSTGKAALLRASRKLKTWTYNRVKDVYYADRRIKISGEEIDGLRELSSAKKTKEAANDPSIAELRGQLALVVKHLHRIDPSFRHPALEELCSATHSDSGNENSSSSADGREC